MAVEQPEEQRFPLGPGSDGPWLTWAFDEVHQEHGWQVWTLDPASGARWELAFVPGAVAETLDEAVTALRQHLYDALGDDLGGDAGRA